MRSLKIYIELNRYKENDLFLNVQFPFHARVVTIMSDIKFLCLQFNDFLGILAGLVRLLFLIY